MNRINEELYLIVTVLELLELMKKEVTLVLKICSHTLVVICA